MTDQDRPANHPVFDHPWLSESLDEAHYFLHECVEHYHDAELVRFNLNAAIQALRNVTFRIQAHKDEIPSFDDWYEPWQRCLGADSSLRWVKDARTTVVHKKGLETASRASVELIYSYEQSPIQEFDLPASLPTHVLVTRALESVPEALAKNSLVEVKRRWISGLFPDANVLDVAGRALSVLGAMAFDLSRYLSEGGLVDVASLADGAALPDCLENIEESTAIRVTPGSGEYYELVSQGTMRPTEDELEEAESRYGVEALLEAIDPKRVHDPFYFVEAFVLPQARAIIALDGHHVTVVFLRIRGAWVPQEFRSENRLEKYLMWRSIAKTVAKTKADGVILVAEAWFAHADAFNGELYPDIANAEGRIEGLHIYAESEDGPHRSWVLFFRHVNGRTVVDEPIIDDVAGMFLEPVREVWRSTSADC
ncbi:MAG: hypothetical protein P1T08_06395 [Acidimicrobiia bacterium]|nr:hypothetical protein [Acidimicrobiia bacterium]